MMAEPMKTPELCYPMIQLKSDSETLGKREFTPAILFLFGLCIIHSVGGE